MKLVRSEHIPRPEIWQLKRLLVEAITVIASGSLDASKMCTLASVETVWRCFMSGLLALLATSIPLALEVSVRLVLFSLIRAKWGCDSSLRSCFPLEKPLLLISQRFCVFHPDKNLAELALAQNRVQYILCLLLLATFQYPVVCQSPQCSCYSYPHLFYHISKKSLL